MPLVEPEIESCQSETAPVKHEIHGSATNLSGPEKIQAILQMPEPMDVAVLKRFLGMVTYLAKFMLHLLQMTEPLGRPEDNNVEFQWLPQHSLAINTIKKFLTETSVLRYYDVNKPFTVQCDASQSGLGTVLLQDGQPVCYASRATWSCDKLDQYLLGRDIEVYIQKRNSQVTQASAANVAGLKKVQP